MNRTPSSSYKPYLKAMFIAFLFLLLLLVLIMISTGCSTMLGPNQLTAAQLKEKAKDKNANITCSQVNGMWGNGTVVMIELDQKVIDNGGVVIEPGCKTTINTFSLPQVKP